MKAPTSDSTFEWGVTTKRGLASETTLTRPGLSGMWTTCWTRCARGSCSRGCSSRPDSSGIPCCLETGTTTSASEPTCRRPWVNSSGPRQEPSHRQVPKQPQKLYGDAASDFAGALRTWTAGTFTLPACSAVFRPTDIGCSRGKLCATCVKNFSTLFWCSCKTSSFRPC